MYTSWKKSQKRSKMEELKEQGNRAKDMLFTGAKTVAKVGEYPIHLITSKEVVKYVEKPVHTIKTWMKFTAVMLAAALLLWQLVDKIRSYVDNPVIVNPEYSYEEKLPFPGVIICNSQPLRYSHINEYSDLFHIINQSALTIHAAGLVNTSDPLDSFHFTEANKINLKEFYLNASQPVHDFIVGCKWPGVFENCSDSNFQLVITDYGPCYRLVLPFDDWPNMTSAGSFNSLRVVVNVDIEGSFPSSSSETVGAFIALYPQDDPTPVVSHIGFNAPPGFETSISVTSEFVKRLPLSKKGSCNPQRKLVLFKNYTTVGCYLENQFISRVNACSCFPYNLPIYRNPEATSNESLKIIELLNSSDPCNADLEFRCASQHWEDYEGYGINGQEIPSCPEACEVQKYSSDLTYSLISGRQLQSSLTERKRENIRNNREKTAKVKGQRVDESSYPQYYRENFIILNIYFKELVHVRIVQHLMYDGLNFAGDIAGTIGIILGFLLTTLGEVIENCHMLYRKLRGVVEPEVVKVTEKEEHIRPEHFTESQGRAGDGIVETELA